MSGVGSLQSEPGNEQLEDGERNDVRTGCHREDKQLVKGEVALDDPGKGRATESSGCASNSDHGGDSGGGKHVGGSREEIGAPALMRGCECDE